jgi:hypothetical protein
MYGGGTPVGSPNPSYPCPDTFHILDVPSRTWTKAESPGIWLYMTCSIIGNTFLIWRGFNGKTSVNSTPIFSSLSQRKWLHSVHPFSRLAGKCTRTWARPSGVQCYCCVDVRFDWDRDNNDSCYRNGSPAQLLSILREAAFWPYLLMAWKMIVLEGSDE